MIGQTVSHYRIIEKLGKGGMGVVYLAEDKHLARRVAIKFLSSLDHHYRARFIREARAVSSLTHPNIATVYDYGETPEGVPFIVMEYLKGSSLSDLLESRGVTVLQAAQITAAITEALSEAHHVGIVHRDIKPSNIMITEREQVKVLDFGLVKHLFEEPSASVDLDAETLYSTQTRSDVIVGTPLYLSPEQASGKAVDGRSDLFALGALLYECLTGQSAFTGGSVLEIGAQIIHVTPPPPSQLNPRVPVELDRITLKALEKKVENRYQSANDLLKDLRRAMAGLSGDGQLTKSVLSRNLGKGPTSRSNALITFTTSLRRQRFSLSAIIVSVLLTSAAIWAVVRWWPHSVYRPQPTAAYWYNIGAEGLRNGAYYQASKAFQQAINIDGAYALAHARLAQAWGELDYTDRAKDELLSVGDRALLSAVDALYLDGITATVRRDFTAAIGAYSQIVKLSPDDPHVYVDLGYAFENNGDVDQALQQYLIAIQKNNQYATAYLRGGIVYNRKQDAANASKFFDTAESLYQTQSNVEGVNEVLRQRGILFRDKGQYIEAEKQFQLSVDGASTIKNEAQQINALIELSYLYSIQGRNDQAESKANEAVQFARTRNLENLVAGGLLELGNSFSSRGDHKTAEAYFKEAINFAQSNKGKLREARGKANLGGLYIQQLQTQEGLNLVQEALTYFQQNNYPKNVSSCLTQIARAHRRLGDYQEALNALGQKLAIAQQGGSQPAIADTYLETGAVLFDQEDYPAALQQYDEALKIYRSVGNQLRIVFTEANRGNILWRLGRYDDARQTLSEVTAALDQSKTEFKQLAPVVRLVNAEMNLSNRELSQAGQKTTEAMALAGKDYPEVNIQATLLMGMLKTLSGSAKEGETLCAEAIKIAGTSSDAALLSHAMLAQAEAAFESGDAHGALTIINQLQERLSRGGQLESRWRGWLIASRASARLGDKTAADEQLGRAKAALKQLEQGWGSDVYKAYTSRPDIQVYYKQLGSPS
ncbi:MAG: tetratricopeptide repeat protein [Pyrinomonadaceae bacterium]